MMNLSNRLPVDKRIARGNTFHAMLVTPSPNVIDYINVKPKLTEVTDQ